MAVNATFADSQRTATPTAKELLRVLRIGDVGAPKMAVYRKWVHRGGNTPYQIKVTKVHVAGIEVCVFIK